MKAKDKTFFTFFCLLSDRGSTLPSAARSKAAALRDRTRRQSTHPEIFKMVRSIQQIEQDLTSLSDSVAAVAEKLQESYRRYLEQLGRSACKQLILACYQICTQAYPERFLALPFDRREKLQQNLRKLGKQLSERLRAALEKPEEESGLSDEAIAQEERSEAESIAEVQLEELLPEEISGRSRSPEDLDDSEERDEGKPAKSLYQWLQHLEESLHQILQTSSGTVNSLLRDAGILPEELPPKLLEMAIQSEEAGAATSGPPNLLNLLIEATPEDSEKDSSVLQVAAIRLRLSEIEFADPSLGGGRNEIRGAIATLKKLAKQERKYHQELAIAQAELAWRSSWYEED